MPFSELFTAAVAAAAVAVTEAGAVAGTWATGCDGCSLAMRTGGGAVWGAEDGGRWFSVMMPRNKSCRVWRDAQARLLEGEDENQTGTTQSPESHTINKEYIGVRRACQEW